VHVTGLESWPVAGFAVCGVDPLDSIAKQVVEIIIGKGPLCSRFHVHSSLSWLVSLTTS
jgi:hypothetical protein